MSARVTVKGWCPGALRPMMSGDGLLVRVRVRDAMLAPSDALALADLSQRFGNGAIDLTRRANLQIRGVSEAQWPALIDALHARGLIGAEEEAGQAVNILMSPLSGLDPSMSLDARLLAARIESGLLADARFRELPSKFGFAIDGRGVLPLGATDADIELRAFGGDTRIAVSIGGSSRCAIVGVEQAADAALALVRAFLHLRGSERRLRALADRLGAEAVFADAGLDASAQSATGERTPGPLGLSRCGHTHMLGVAAPFGAWIAEDFAAVAWLALCEPGASLRVTPWRALLVAGLPHDAAIRALDELSARGLIVSPADRRLSAASCIGAPSCNSASVATRALAERLAPLFTPSHGDISLHVSGCAKGCAHPHGAPVTFVGRGNRYDLILDGRPDAVPSIAGLDFDGALTQTRKMLSS